jgi:hypothetical protein
MLYVEDARYFTDGMGLIEGDLIRVGANEPVRVLDIDYLTGAITLDQAIQWGANEGVSYPYSGQAPDMGMFEYGLIDAARGDVNGDGVLTAADVIFLVNYVFKGGAAPPGMSGDANCDISVTSADVIYLVNHIFKSGPAPNC